MCQRGHDIKTIFRQSSSLNLRLLLFVLLSCGFLVADHHGALGRLRTGLTTLIYPLQRVVSAPTRLFGYLADSLSSRAELLAENRRLREERLELKTRLLKFASMEQENTRLRGLLESSFKVGEQMQIAEVLSINVVPYEHLIVVNKGARFSAHVGQPVFDASGVVGQVVRVAANSAEVMLITDANHGIPVQVNRTGLRTVAVGTGQIDRVVLPYLSGSADIQVGDLLVTSGMGGVFPQGYPVATVTDIGHQGSPFAKVSAVPAAKLASMREVLLVWSNSEPIPRLSAQARSPLDNSTHLDPTGSHSHVTETR